jgi:hypothetical protein
VNLKTRHLGFQFDDSASVHRESQDKAPWFSNDAWRSILWRKSQNCSVAKQKSDEWSVLSPCPAGKKKPINIITFHIGTLCISANLW